MIRRLWLLVSIGWTLFMLWAMNWERNIPQQLLLMAVPWIAGIILYWIVVGRLPGQPQGPEIL